MGRIRSLRRFLGRLERDQEGTVLIPQKDGSVARFAEEDQASAYLSALDRALGRDVAKHPMITAIENSSDPRWRDTYFDLEPSDEPPEDLSE